MRRSIAMLGFVLLLLLPMIGATGARALTCSAGMTPISFGEVDVLAGARHDSAGVLTVSCADGPQEGGHVVRACASIGPGQSSSYPPRQLRNGSSALQFDLYPAATGDAPWGSWSGAYGAYLGVEMDIALVDGRGSAQRNVYGSILPSQKAAPAGAYVASFADAATNLAYAVDAASTPCSSLAGAVTQFQFVATATVRPNCLVVASDLSFGSVGDLSRPVDGQTSLQLTCSSGLAFVIGLDGGRAQASDPRSRRMTNGTESVVYGLYRDAGRVSPWGSTAGVDAYAGTGVASAVSIPVYGRIPAGQTPTAGLYSDVIVVTVTY
jgi:spore coat protein U-like protein